MTIDALIRELQQVVAEKPERAGYQVEDQDRRTIGWVCRGSAQDEAHRIVRVLPEVDF